jgi:hypothetical protein
MRRSRGYVGDSQISCRVIDAARTAASRCRPKRGELLASGNVRADGTVLPPFDGGKSIIGPWGIAIDGNDNVWVANAMGRSVTQLCGARPENCPPGKKTGDPISPSSGYIGGLQIITDVAIDPAGNLWVANNWDRPGEGFKKVPEPALSTRFGGNGTVVFFGLAKPVRTPLIGPPQAP